MKEAGILMPVSTLPSTYGAGDFGKETYHFIDAIAKAKLKIWQILPLQPLGAGNSPYQPYSSYAIDPIYISLELLYEKGYLKHKPKPYPKSNRIDFKALRSYKEPYFKEAIARFKPNKAYHEFIRQQGIQDYARFMVLRHKNDEKSWLEWQAFEVNEDELYPYFVLQYFAYTQWQSILTYAHRKGLRIFGDIPFYVGLESGDVYFHQDQFLLDDDGRPTFIAGVPPDYFSATGQRWGNPIYHWDVMEADGFGFWLERLRYCKGMMDIVRIDHFRAFDTYWTIPSDCPTAIDGAWREAPGYAFFDALQKADIGLEIVAEDLGEMRMEVHVLKDHYDLPGMRIFEFTFQPHYIEENDRENLVVYTGTHDNMPLMAWYKDFSAKEKAALRKALKARGYDASFLEMVLSYCLDQNAKYVIIPYWDWLGLGKQARINTPGTMGDDNWSYQAKSLSAFMKNIGTIKAMVKKSSR